MSLGADGNIGSAEVLRGLTTCFKKKPETPYANLKVLYLIWAFVELSVLRRKNKKCGL